MSEIKSNGSIELHKSDTFEFKLPVNMGSNLEEDWYRFQPDDKIQFYLTRLYLDYSNACFRKCKTVTDFEDFMTISITPTDIENLHCGRYYYGIVLECSGKQLIFLNKKECTILE